MAEFDFERAFSFLFKDPDWAKKVLLGGVIMIIPILGAIWVLGHCARLAQNVARDVEYPMPDWDFGRDVGLGFKVFIAGLVWALPFIVIMFVALGGAIVAAESGGASEDDIIMVSYLIQCLSIPVSLIMQVWLPTVWIHVAMTETIGAGFQFSRLYEFIRANPKPYFLAVIVQFLANMVAGLGYIACVIGVFFTIAASMMIAWHAIGQVWRIDQLRRGASPATEAFD